MSENNNNAINFTKQTLEAMPNPFKGVTCYRDTKEKGQSLYITSTGVITFSIRRRVQRRGERIILGRFPEIKCWGIRNGRGDAALIPDMQGTYLKFVTDENGQSYASPKQLFRPDASSWHDLLFLEKEIRTFWPDAPIQQKATMPDGKKLENAFKALIADARKDGKTLNEKSLYKGMNSALAPEKITYEWARKKMAAIPLDVRKKRGQRGKK